MSVVPSGCGSNWVWFQLGVVIVHKRVCIIDVSSPVNQLTVR